MTRFCKAALPPMRMLQLSMRVAKQQLQVLTPRLPLRAWKPFLPVDLRLRLSRCCWIDPLRHSTQVGPQRPQAARRLSLVSLGVAQAAAAGALCTAT